ncbi:trichome birefringence-like 14 [Zostera marina]|uniref:Trichome birefringence-like 14 n=1 Tax=Zostera marina TaxID=29655 RepID=A0A0K9PKM4_ZOSMR|nr:trichome birefringence-like 14 [Zostera marina]
MVINLMNLGISKLKRYNNGVILASLALVFVLVSRSNITSRRIKIQFPWRQWKNQDGVKYCNYGVGKWVPENMTRPIYSGSNCRRWVSSSMNCNLMPRRKDFSYESFRWQPDNCDVPDFDHQVMKNKTIAFVGDSLGRQQFQSLMCMATAGGRLDGEVEDVGIEYNFVKPINGFVKGSSAYRFRITNTTILFHWAVTLCQLIKSSSSDHIALHIDRIDPFIAQSLNKIHVLVLNTKHHWTGEIMKKEKWVVHLNGSPVKDKNLNVPSNARNFAVSNVVHWLDSRLSRYPELKVFFRTFSPNQFVNGNWNTGGTCDNLTPLVHGDRIPVGNGSYDTPAVNAIIQASGVKLLDVTGLSILRDEAHVSKFGIHRYDCIHWCLPGIPDEWNNILNAQI